MKKLLIGFLTLVLTTCFCCKVYAADIEGLYDKYQAVYLPSTNSWSTGSMAPDRVVLTKKTTEGSGSYSEYYGITLENNKLKQAPLSDKKLKALFPSAKIVKISEAKDGVITVKKELFKKQEILLVNDTDKYFHKYTISPAKVQKTDIKGLLTISKYGETKFASPDNSDVITIKTVKGKYPVCACGEDCKCKQGEDCKCKDCK